MHGPVSQVQAHDSQTLVHHSAWACPIHIGIMIADVFLVCCQSYLFIVATITIIPMIGMMLPVSFPFIIMIPCKQVGCDCDRIMDVSWFTCHSLKVEDNGHEQGLPWPSMNRSHNTLEVFYWPYTIQNMHTFKDNHNQIPKHNPDTSKIFKFSSFCLSAQLFQST